MVQSAFGLTSEAPIVFNSLNAIQKFQVFSSEIQGNLLTVTLYELKTKLHISTVPRPSTSIPIPERKMAPW